jgi:ribonuclease P protein component
VGFIVPRYKHSAVDRNRLKRRLREIVRTTLLPVLPAVDIVVRARPEAYRAPVPALGAQLARAAERLTRGAVP